MEQFDVSYVTNDSVAEGVGSSQIIPLIKRLAADGLKINLISYEKLNPSGEMKSLFEEWGVIWFPQVFDGHGTVKGLLRYAHLPGLIPTSKIVHARSDIPTVAGILAKNGPVLWDVRSLWSDQRAYMEENPFKKRAVSTFKLAEKIAGNKSHGLSTLTSSIVPVLEKRHKRLPEFRTVVPTCVDLELFRIQSLVPQTCKVLFSGTYNNYYDLELSRIFLEKLSQFITLEIHWARPTESSRKILGVGEHLTFNSRQKDLSSLIPNYSFGMSICKLDAGLSLKSAMPTKVAEFLACGRPIVVNKGLGDLDDFISEFDAGVVLDGTLEDINLKVQKLIELLADKDTPGRCRSLAEKYFDIDLGAQKYIKLYNAML